MAKFYSVSLCLSIEAKNEEEAKHLFYELITDPEFDCDGDSIDVEWEMDVED